MVEGCRGLEGPQASPCLSNRVGPAPPGVGDPLHLRHSQRAPTRPPRHQAGRSANCMPILGIESFPIPIYGF